MCVVHYVHDVPAIGDASGILLKLLYDEGGNRCQESKLHKTGMSKGK